MMADSKEYGVRFVRFISRRLGSHGLRAEMSKLLEAPVHMHQKTIVNLPTVVGRPHASDPPDRSLRCLASK